MVVGQPKLSAQFITIANLGLLVALWYTLYSQVATSTSTSNWVINALNCLSDVSGCPLLNIHELTRCQLGSVPESSTYGVTHTVNKLQ